MKNPDSLPAIQSISETTSSIESEERAREIIHAIDEFEVQIDVMVENEIQETGNIMKRLLALGATQEEIAKAEEELAKVDSEIRTTKYGLFQNMYARLDKFYTEKVQYLGKSVVAEVKMRAIDKKYLWFDEENRKKLDKYLSNKYANRPDDSGYDTEFDLSSDMFVIAQNFKKIPKMVSDGKLKETNIRDIQTYQEHYQYRRFESDRGYKPTLQRLYAIQLNEIRDKLKDNDDTIAENLDAYFHPAVKTYKDIEGQQIFNEKNADPEKTGYHLNMCYRVRGFVSAMKSDGIVLSNNQKETLRETVVSLFEKSSDDIARNMFVSVHLRSFQYLINICDFSSDQKKILNGVMFEMIFKHKERSILDIFDNPDFPYTEEQLERILDETENYAIAQEGIKVPMPHDKTRFTEIVLKKVVDFPFTESQKDKLSQRIFNDQLQLMKGVIQVGKYDDLLFQIKVLDPGNRYLDTLLGSDRRQELINFGRSSIVETVKNHIDHKIYDLEHSISVAHDIKDVLSNIPDEFKSGAEEYFKSKKDQIPWWDDLEKMMNIQKRPKRAEYDPWINQIDPLFRFSMGTQSLTGEAIVRYATEESLLSLENKKDGTLFADYIKQFGAKNLPHFFTLFVNIKRSGSIDTMQEETKITLKETFSIDPDLICKSDPKNLNLITNELEKYVFNFAKDVMDEKMEVVDKALTSDIYRELLMSVKGASGHSQGDSLQNVLSTYKKTRTESPELFTLPEGYETVRFDVTEYKDEVELDQEEVEKQSKLILSNPDLMNYYQKLYTPIYGTKDPESFVERLQESIEQVGQEFDSEVENIFQKIQEGGVKIDEDKREKALESLKKRQAVILEQQKAFQAFSPEDVTDSVALMEKYHQLIPDSFKSKASLLLELSSHDIAKKFPEQLQVFGNERVFTEKPTIDGVSILKEFVQSHIKEHYLDAKHGENQSLKTSDPTLLKYLKKVWGTQDFDKGTLAIAHNKLSVLERGELSEKKRSITMIPSKGMQRIFSGDLAGACTSRKNVELAKGEYGGLISYSFVLDKGTPKERFVGSCLVIETKTDAGEPILVIRANNPQENLAQMLDAQELIHTTIEEVKKVAKRREISLVAVVFDECGMASSNRSYVVDYYKKNFKKEDAIGLISTAETTFNGYDIWNKNGFHRCVLVK